MSEITKPIRKQAVINLDELGKIRATPSHTLKQIRNARAAEQILRSEPVMPLVTDGAYLGQPLFEFDESDPLFQGEDTIEPQLVSKNHTQEPNLNIASNNTSKNSSSTMDSSDDDFMPEPTTQVPTSNIVAHSHIEKYVDAKHSSIQNVPECHPHYIGNENASTSSKLHASTQVATKSSNSETHPLLFSNDGLSVKQNILSNLADKEKGSNANSTQGIANTHTSKKPQPSKRGEAANKRKLDKVSIDGERPTKKPHEKNSPIESSKTGYDQDDADGSDWTVPNLSPEDDMDIGYDEEEINILRKLDSDICYAEEKEVMEQLDDEITEAEFSELDELTWNRIKEAVTNHEKPGGRAQNVVDPKEAVTHEQSCKDRDWGIHEAKLTCKIVASQIQQCNREIKVKGDIVLDVDFVGNPSLCVKKEVPKFIGNSSDLLIEKEDLEKYFKNSKGIKFRNFHISIRDKVDDPQTVVVEFQGNKAFVDEAQEWLVNTLRLNQLRFIDLGNKLRPPTGTVTAKSSNSRGILLYKRFAKKFEKIKDIDFGGIHLSSVVSSMWQRHKERYGSACISDCQCSFHLDDLTSTVISDMMKKHPNTQRPREVGFSKYFAPKFMPLLKEEFPKESNENLFNRLCKMWESHLKQQRFGTICRQGCPCLEGWASVFKRGHDSEVIRKGNTFLVEAAPLGQLEKNQAHISRPADSGQKEYEVVFDAKKNLGFYVMTTKDNKCQIHSVSPSVKDSRISPGTIITAAALGTSAVWEPIASYKRLRKFYKICRVSPNDTNIRIRFINTDVKKENTRDRGRYWSANSTWIGSSNLQGWDGSLREFESGKVETPASAISNEARLISENSKRVVKKTDISISRNASLTTDNNAKGVDVLPSHSVHVGTSLDAYVDTKVFQTSDKAVTEDVSANSKQTAIQVSGQMHNAANAVFSQPRHRSSTFTTSILKKSSKFQTLNPKQVQSMFRNLANAPKRSKPVLIKWAPEFETTVFDKSLNASESLKFRTCSEKLSTEEPESRDISSSEVVRSHAELIQAISHKGCLEVFELLKAGADTRPEGVHSKDIPENYAKSIRDSLLHILRTNPTEEAKKKFDEIVCKVNLLKIFDRARDVMANSACLKKWARYEVRMDRVENLRLTNAAPLTKGDNFVCQIMILGEILGTKQLAEEWAESIHWPDTRGTRYKFYYNESLPDRYLSGERTFVLTFFKSVGNSDRLIELAKQSRQLDEIKSAVTATDSAMLTVDMPKTDKLQSGKALLLIRKLRDETKSKIGEKRERYRKELKQLINDMKAFNSDKRRESAGMPELDFDMQQPESPHITPLHAAVYLNDVALVTELISCGADINIKNEKGVSPRTLALMIDEVISKDQDRESERHTSKMILKLLGVREDSDEVMEDLNINDEDVEDKEQSNEEISSTDDKPRHSKAFDGHSILNTKSYAADVVYDAKHYTNSHSSKHNEHSLLSPDKDPNSFYSADDLPTMTLKRLAQGKKLCHHYDSSRGCLRGRACFFLHVENVNPEGVDLRKQYPMYSPLDLCIKEELDGFGKKCYTALYRDREKNIYLKAIGGKTLGPNHDDLYWYRSREDATEAIEKVITLWQNPHLNPTLNDTKLDNSSKKSSKKDSALAAYKRDENKFVTDEEARVFKSLCTTNLSNTFAFIVKMPGRGNSSLKNVDWIMNSLPGGWWNASFTKRISQSFPIQTFTSMNNGNSKSVQGVYYHPDINEAKASAFLEFLKFVRSIGLLSSLTTRADSKCLPFWKPDNV